MKGWMDFGQWLRLQPSHTSAYRFATVLGSDPAGLKSFERCHFSWQGRCFGHLFLAAPLFCPFPSSTRASLRCRNQDCAFGKGGTRQVLAFVCQHFGRRQILLPSGPSLIPQQFSCHHIMRICQGGRHRQETRLLKTRARSGRHTEPFVSAILFGHRGHPQSKYLGKEEGGPKPDLSNPPTTLSTSPDDGLFTHNSQTQSLVKRQFGLL